MFLPSENNAGVLRYEVFPGEPVDEFTWNVLNQNAPKGVLLLGRETTEEYDHLLLPVSQVLSIRNNYHILKEKTSADKFLSAVWAVRDSLPGHMVPPGELVLRPEFTWFEPETGDPVLLVLPTPVAGDLTLSPDAYEVLIRALLAQETEKSANPSAKRAAPARPWRQILRDFWENLD